MERVKVFIAIENTTGDALRKVLELFSVRLVEDIKEADLIIVESYLELGKIFSQEKWFGIFTNDKVDKTVPENVRVIPILQAFAALMEFIVEISKSISDKIVDESEVEELLPDARKILVIEDTPRHQKSAWNLLKGHRLIVVGSYDEAMDILAKEKFEIVLSDLYLPMSPETLSEKAFEVGRLVSYGLLLAVEAARSGASYVVVATDLNHHADPISAAFDHFSRFPVRIEDAKVVFMHAPMKDVEGERVKDWRDIIVKLLI